MSEQRSGIELVRELHDQARFLSDAAKWLPPNASEILGKRAGTLHDLADGFEALFSEERCP